MNDLTSWLRQQLDTDEQAALAANVKQDDPEWWVSPVAGTGGEHFTVRSRRDNRPIARVQRLDGDEGEPAGILSGSAVALHIANHDVARAVRQVQAHRAILDEHVPIDGWVIDREVEKRGTVCRCCSDEGRYHIEREAFEFYPCKTVRALASIYSDRDGYNPEWSV